MLSYDGNSGTGDWGKALVSPGRKIMVGSWRKWCPESRINSKPRGRLVQTQETEDSRDTEKTSPIMQARYQWSWSPRPLDWGQARNECEIIGITDDIIVHSMTLNVSLNIFKHLRLLFQKHYREQMISCRGYGLRGCGREKERNWWGQCAFVKHEKGCSDKCDRMRRRVFSFQVPGIGNWSMVTVLVRASFSVMKHHDPNYAGEERAYFSTCR